MHDLSRLQDSRHHLRRHLLRQYNITVSILHVGYACH